MAKKMSLLIDGPQRAASPVVLAHGAGAAPGRLRVRGSKRQPSGPDVDGLNDLRPLLNSPTLELARR